MTVEYNFIKGSCDFSGSVFSNDDKSILLLANCGTCQEKDIIPAYEKYGIECVNHLEGVFSFCLYDLSKKQLFVARDRIGEKTVYYSQLPTSIVFSSELNAILPEIKYPSINAHAFAEGIRYNYPIELQQTWIEQIKRLRPGEYAIVDAGGLQLHTYWKRDHTPSFTGSKQDAIQKALSLMRQSVKRCIETANGPVAVLLSGGIDSSSLAAFAKEVQQDVHVFSAGYKGNKYTQCDEREVAKKYAKEKGLIYHEVELDINDFQSLLDELIPYIDEPCFDVSCMAQFALYKKASEMGYKVILSGLGGDEQFYSYSGWNRTLNSIQVQKNFQDLFPWKGKKLDYLRFILKHWRYVLFAGYPDKLDESEPEGWIYKDYKSFSNNARINYGNESIIFSDIDIKYIFQRDIDINGIYDFIFSRFMVQLCLFLGNKLGQANGVKLRFPLLDSALVEFLDSLPLEMKFDSMHPKKFQKEIMEGIIPDYILYARKRGFEPPYDFIKEIISKYKYRHIDSSYVFFNSMLADQLLDILL